ncbi:hypothetical protein [Rhizobium lentis]|uniref:hypothetical protein n=1 Tax=Rhizobium lentis TaxID=1138194 RepID=UPI001C83D2E8|nr:hypothetical protein [Rhizobium lentis]MBX5112674.1 hypothetical protein [Rhizobium lentis]
MPFAAANKISTGHLPGGITISEAQYTQALAGMTSKAAPKKVSVANGFQMVAPSFIEPIALMEAITLPSLGSRNPVCTGLARHPLGTGWLVGDDGRPVNGTTTDGGVIWYNDDFTDVIENFKAIPTLGLTSQHSIQGVCAVPGSNEFWCIGRLLPTTGNSRVLKCDATTGAVLLNVPCQNTGNGIAVVPEHGIYYTLQTTGELTKWDMAGVYLPSIVDLNTQTTNDMLQYLGDGKMLMTYGANLSSGYISVVDITGASPVMTKTVQLPGSNAIEGVAIHDGFIWICNDGEYHSASPALNRVLKYSLGNLLD